MPILREQANIIIKRDISPNFISRKLIDFLEEIKVIKPPYTVLQSLVSKTLTNERNRISTILSTFLDTETKIILDQIIIREANLSTLAGFKQDAKNFGFKMMLKERQKQDILRARNVQIGTLQQT